MAKSISSVQAKCESFANQNVLIPIDAIITKKHQNRVLELIEHRLQFGTDQAAERLKNDLDRWTAASRRQRGSSSSKHWQDHLFTGHLAGRVSEFWEIFKFFLNAKLIHFKTLAETIISTIVPGYKPMHGGEYGRVVMCDAIHEEMYKRSMVHLRQNPTANFSLEEESNVLKAISFLSFRNRPRSGHWRIEQ
jgi:hypothetical protein